MAEASYQLLEILSFCYRERAWPPLTEKNNRNNFSVYIWRMRGKAFKLNLVLESKGL